MSEVEVIYSLPSAYSGFVNITRPAEYFTACYTVCSVPKRPNKVETVVHARLPFNSFQFGLYRVVAPLSFLRSISLASLFTTLHMQCSVKRAVALFVLFRTFQVFSVRASGCRKRGLKAGVRTVTLMA